MQTIALGPGIQHQQCVAWLTQGPHLLHQTLQSIVAKGQGREWRAVALTAPRQQGSHHGGESGPHIAAGDQHLASTRDAAGQGLHGLGHRPGQPLRGLVEQIGRLEELLLDTLLKHGDSSYDTRWR
jgi:hypothetical protein